MSREIKFRAWYPTKGVMFHDFGFWPSDPSYVFLGEQQLDKLDEDLIESGEYYEDIRYFHGVELMQFTGLKDRNGRDIYEGDIVSFDTSIPAQPFGDNPDPGEPRNSWGQVIFSSGCFILNHCTHPLDTYSPELFNLIEELGDGEVLGNIYETPELLEAKQ